MTPRISSCLALALTSTLATALTSQNSFWIDRGPAPAGTCGSQLVYDAARGVTLLVGTNNCNQTHAWDGQSWTQVGSGPHGSDWLGGLVYDSARQVVVAVVGNQSTGVDTYEWDGSTWTLKSTSGIPSRGNFSLVYDEARGQTLLFGGHNGGTPTFADLWAWDGVSWTPLYFGGPTPRRNASVVWDAEREVVVLFGGRGLWTSGQEEDLDDTWEWNGFHWSLHFGVPGPVGRRAAGFAFDRSRNKAVLVGGITSQGWINDTWEWDGSSWQMTATSLPGVNQIIAGTTKASYDPTRGVTTTFAGQTGTTLEYFRSPTVVGSATTYGAGCAGPAGVPTLSPAPGSTPAIGGQLQMDLSNLPSSIFNVAVGFLGFDAQQWAGVPLPIALDALGFTGCEALLAPAVSAPLQNINGSASWDVDVPLNTAMLGAQFYFQAAVSVPAWNPGGFVFSNGVEFVIGTP